MAAKLKKKIPFNYTHEPFFQALEATLVMQPVCPPKEIYLIVSRYTNSSWNCVVLWLLKKQMKIFTPHEWGKIREMIPAINAYEPTADLLLAVLELADAVLDFLPPGTVTYTSPWIWWELCITEVRAESFLRHFGTAISKEEIKGEISNTIQNLKSWRNPYNPTKFTDQHIYNLIEAAIAIGEPQGSDTKAQIKQRQKFYKRAWIPLRKAFQAYWQALDKGVEDFTFLAGWIDQEELTLQVGRHPIKISFPPLKKKRAKMQSETLAQ